MYEIVFSDKALKQLKKLEKQVQRRMVEALERIRIRPEGFITRLMDDPGYKFRVGDYRVILDIHHGQLQILILKVGHRKDIYKNL